MMFSKDASRGDMVILSDGPPSMDNRPSGTGFFSHFRSAQEVGAHYRWIIADLIRLGVYVREGARRDQGGRAGYDESPQREDRGRGQRICRAPQFLKDNANYIVFLANGLSAI